MGGKPASRFSDCQQICQSANLLADKVTVSKSASQQICWQKWGVNLAADLVIVSKSASQQIYWQKCPPISASKFADSQEIYWEKYLPFLPAEIPGYFC